MRISNGRELIGVFFMFALLTANLGMRFAGAPGDCVVPDDSSFASVDGGCKDLTTGRVWSLQRDGSASWADQSTYCNNLSEGGQTDWRMPTIAELQAVYTDGALGHLAIVQRHVYNWSSTNAKAKIDYQTLRFEDGDVKIHGTKPGSKYGWWHLHVICTR